MEARKETKRITADTKKLFTLYNREVGGAVKVAKKVKKALNAAAKITY